jgi:acyl-CoA dehydrogenase
VRIFDRSLLALPIYEDRHRQLASELESWIEGHTSEIASWRLLPPIEAVRTIATALGDGGWLARALTKEPGEVPDFRALCLIREGLAYADDLLDFVLSIQSLGAYLLGRYGTAELVERYFPAMRAGRCLGTFAVSEGDAASDIQNVACAALPVGAEFRVTGRKCWIANATAADVHCVIVRTGGPGPLGLSALLVPADTSGLRCGEPIELIAPRPFADLVFDGCRVPRSALIGREGHGLRLALELLERYRPSVGAAALGFARRAMSEALQFSGRRHVGGARLFDQQMTRERFADMALTLDTASLHVARTAYEFDRVRDAPFARHASGAKLLATEGAQRVVDSAQQMFGAAGVVRGSVPERLYRQVRSLRIYEGTSEVQKLIIAQTLGTESRATEAK